MLDLENFAMHDMSIVATNYRLCRTKMDAYCDKLDRRRSVDNTCDGRPLVYHTDRPLLSTARFRRAGISATADTSSASSFFLLETE